MNEMTYLGVLRHMPQMSLTNATDVDGKCQERNNGMAGYRN